MTTEKKQNRTSMVLIGLLVVFAAIALYAGYQLISWYRNAHAEQQDIEALREMVETAENAEGDAATEMTAYERYQTLFDSNPDMVGWISIAGTKIDYPVMQTLEEPEYYLHRNFEQEYAACGLPFADANCTFDPQSDNVILYGHHMKDGSMFHDLNNYKDKTFYEEHPLIQFNTRWGYGTYQIIAAFKTQVDTVNAWPYYQFIEAESPEAFADFVGQCQDRALYDTGYTAEYGDQLLTLSTCEYSTENGRMVIVAKQVES